MILGTEQGEGVREELETNNRVPDVKVSETKK
jgi:hypothetical protein